MGETNMFYQDYRQLMNTIRQSGRIRAFLVQRKLDKKKSEFLNELTEKYGFEYRTFFEALLKTIEENPKEKTFCVEFWDIPRPNGSPIQKWVDTDPQKRKETLKIMSLQSSHYGESISFEHCLWWEAWISIW